MDEPRMGDVSEFERDRRLQSHPPRGPEDPIEEDGAPRLGEEVHADAVVARQREGCCYFLKPCGLSSVCWVVGLVVIVVAATGIGALAGMVISVATSSAHLMHIKYSVGIGGGIGLLIGVIIVVIHLVYMHCCKRLRNARPVG